jgi:hypothetical protein
MAYALIGREDIAATAASAAAEEGSAEGERAPVTSTTVSAAAPPASRNGGVDVGGDALATPLAAMVDGAAGRPPGVGKRPRQLPDVEEAVRIGLGARAAGGGDCASGSGGVGSAGAAAAAPAPASGPAGAGDGGERRRGRDGAPGARCRRRPLLVLPYARRLQLPAATTSFAGASGLAGVPQQQQQRRPGGAGAGGGLAKGAAGADEGDGLEGLAQAQHSLRFGRDNRLAELRLMMSSVAPQPLKVRRRVGSGPEVGSGQLPRRCPVACRAHALRYLLCSCLIGRLNATSASAALAPN